MATPGLFSLITGDMSTAIGYVDLAQPLPSTTDYVDLTRDITYTNPHDTYHRYRNMPNNNNNNNNNNNIQFNIYPYQYQPSGHSNGRYRYGDPYEPYLGTPPNRSRREAGRQNYRSSLKNVAGQCDDVRIIKVAVYIKVDKPASTKIEEYIHEYHEQFIETMYLQMVPVTDASKYDHEVYPVLQAYSTQDPGESRLYQIAGRKAVKRALDTIRHLVKHNVVLEYATRFPEILRAVIDRDQPITHDEYDRSEISELQAMIRKKEEEKKEMEIILERLEFINKTLIETEDPEPAPGESKELCVVCLAACRDHIFLPCAHMACCATCANYVIHDTKKCPTCRVDVTEIKKIFIA